jgi:hypothetical protein
MSNNVGGPGPGPSPSPSPSPSAGNDQNFSQQSLERKSDSELADLASDTSLKPEQQKAVADEIERRFNAKKSSQNNAPEKSGQQQQPNSVGGDSGGLSSDEEDELKKLLKKLRSGKPLTADEKAKLKELQGKQAASGGDNGAPPPAPGDIQG